MNLFKALNQGHGRISETNFTSFISSLLNDKSELGEAFTVLLLEDIFINIKSPIIKIIEGTTREKIIDFYSKYEVIAEPEYRVSDGKDNKSSIIDIVITISDKNSNPLLYILLELKILDGSFTKGQLDQQFNNFCSNYSNIENRVYSGYLTPISTKIKEEFKDVKNPNKFLLTWLESDNQNSIESIIRTIITEESRCNISPIDSTRKLLLKHFLDFILYEFNNKLKALSIKSKANCKLENADELTIIRYTNDSIEITYNDGKEFRGNIISKLREINSELNLGIKEVYDEISKNRINTRTYGRYVIEKINKKMSCNG